MKHLALVLALVSGLALAGETWTIDDTHSTARFKVRHLLVTNVSGEIGGVQGKFTLDGDDMTKMTIEAKADMRTINTNNKKRDEHLRAEDFFSTKKHAWTSFKSKSVAKNGNAYKITGDLTLRGITKEVTLDSEGLTPPVKDPWGSIRRGFTGTTKINRQDYGVSFNKTLETGGAIVGDEVTLEIEAEIKTDAPKEKKS